MAERSRFLFILAPLLAVLLGACGSTGGASESPTPGLSATAVETPLPSPTAVTLVDPANLVTPDGERILADVETLSAVPRASGSDVERQVAEDIAERLRVLGYEVEIQPVADQREAAGVTLSQASPTQKTLPSSVLQGGSIGAVSAVVFAAGLGNPQDFEGMPAGSIALIERGDLTFAEKVVNAEAAGASAAIIYNNEPGLFYGSLSGASTSLPSVSISQTEGQRLVEELSEGPVELSLEVSRYSQNVIARPPGVECQTITGGHYDSVPVAPGANDNASGTATVIEIARVMAANGRMGSNCFVLFGAEEVGLLGSQTFVASLSATERAQIKAMFNFDMVGVGDQAWFLIGSPELQQLALELGKPLDLSAEFQNVARTGAASDHASFLAAGIPALFVHRTNDDAWHQPEDVAERIEPELVEKAAQLGIALLEAVNGAA